VKKFLKHNALLFLVAALVIVVDQLTKALVRQNLAFGEAWAPIPAIGEFFRFPILAEPGCSVWYLAECRSNINDRQDRYRSFHLRFLPKS